MNLRARGSAALSLGVAGPVTVWVFWAHGLLASAASLLSFVVLGLTWAVLNERRETRRLEAALERESERARRVSEHAWQSALLTQVVEELRTSADNDALLGTAVTALARTLKASRVVFYGRGPDEALRLRAQFAAEGVAPLGVDAVLPAVLASDRGLAERFSVSERIEAESDPELRALVERLGTRSVVLSPVGERGILAVYQYDATRSWTDSEHRFVHRFADQLDGVLSSGAEHRQMRRDVEMHTSLLRVAHALSGARETKAVLEIATSVGAPLAHARASAIFVDGSDRGFRVVAEKGFAPGVATACAQSFDLELEDAIRTRATTRLRHAALAARCPETKALGPVVVVPLYCGREPFGVFMLEKPSDEPGWTEAEMDVAGTLAELTAAALKNAGLFEALTAADARNAELYDDAFDLFHTVDRRGTILDCNRTECRTLGYAKEELVGRRVEDVLAQESVAPFRRLEAQLFEQGTVRDANLKLRARDGRTVDVVVNASATRPSSGGPMTAHVVMRDVSERRRLEQQLRQRQKLEVVGALAGGIAHDFNNVLGGILGNASLLQAQLRDRPYAKRYVETIERSATRGAELTGRLLAAFRKAPAQREAVNVNDVVEETLELLEHTFHKRVRIGKRLDPRVRSILADAGQLQQVVLNLCVNARDAMPQGGLLRVETEVDDREKRLRLSVEDTGVGIEPTKIGRLFEPFFSTKGDGGSGLGLSVVYGIVKSLGGDVRVKSSPGKGACFDIFLPMNWVDDTDQPAPVAEPEHGRGELVLLVDDDVVLRELGKEILEGHGYRVRTVGSGEDALAFFRKSDEMVSLVILDLVMPGLDGGETFRRLRDVDSNVPVLLSSGMSAEDTVQEILARGANGFIPKPYGIGELTRAVSTALKGDDRSLMH